jgi:hypothetical protein
LVVLRYPRARLLVYDRLLLNCSDCIDSFSAVATELGLQVPPDFTEIRRHSESGSCGSLKTAQAILKVSVPDHADKLYTKLKRDLTKVKVQAGLSDCSIISEPDLIAAKLAAGQISSPAIRCGSTSSVIMDLLLQSLDRH